MASNPEIHATPAAPSAAEPGGTPPEEVSSPPRTVTGTRASHTWVALTAGLFFLVVVLVFILENLKSIRVHFFGASWTAPLAVDLLLAAVLGGLIIFAGGFLRIVQLRRLHGGGRRPRPGAGARR